MLPMPMYGVRLPNERRKLWRAAELLTYIWNQDQYSRAVAAAAMGLVCDGNVAGGQVGGRRMDVWRWRECLWRHRRLARQED